MNTTKSSGKPADSINILERIQSKIEEKMTRADTSNGHMAGSMTYRNQLDANGKKSSTSIGGPRRCPNLQRLIEKKKLEEGIETALDTVKGKEDIMAIRKGGSILMENNDQRGNKQIRAKTGELVYS